MATLNFQPHYCSIQCHMILLKSFEYANGLYAKLHYFLNLSQLLCFLSPIIGQTD